ncbi:metal transporter cnnm2 [Plakobranchus ocellatus]|uniref:Metal transporter cnnm2 n=1 Tax=Plakobranchus ocellatus TaxID=259542 RepID=A0AAV3YQW3_9GAST|nr:metal transporter cnnm2 [Plakobranchus ocellatus]
MDFVNCTRVSNEVVSCDGKKYEIPEAILTYKDKWFWIYIGIYVGLVLFAGLMSGLTMGLLSLDYTTLMTMKEGGTPRERKYAARIIPMVKRHHLLLVTLLLSNAAAVEAMPIFLDHVSNPVIAIIVSVTAVLIFGEVVPQAVCTRYGLAIGAYMAPLVYFMMGAFFIVAYPFSKLLDWFLGTDHGTFYRRGQLKALIDIHGEESQGEGHSSRQDALSKDEVLIIKGCLDMKSKQAKDAMLDIDKTYMLSVNAQLDNETMTHIIQNGHSRIPVYDLDRTNIVGCLLTKTLIKLDPDDAVPVSSLIRDGRYGRPPLFIYSNMPLFDLLNTFQTGKSHLAVVRQGKDDVKLLNTGDADSDSAPLLLNIEEPSSNQSSNLGVEDGTVVGIITMEDVIEELLQEEIEDESDITQQISQKISFSMARHRKSQPQIQRAASHPQTSYPREDNVDIVNLSEFLHQGTSLNN